VDRKNTQEGITSNYYGNYGRFSCDNKPLHVHHKLTPTYKVEEEEETQVCNAYTVTTAVDKKACLKLKQ